MTDKQAKALLASLPLYRDSPEVIRQMRRLKNAGLTHHPEYDPLESEDTSDILSYLLDFSDYNEG